MNNSIKEIKQFYFNKYQVLLPSNDSVDLAAELWNTWETTTEETRPNLDNIASNFAQFEEQFFQEIVKITGKITGKNLNIEYCPFILDDYNLSAYSADDGYLIFVDESFFRMLFFLTIVFIYDANNLINEDEKDNAISFINSIINNYFQYKAFDLSKDITPLLLKKNYEIAEFANYFFQSLKIFMIAHEISHHVLGHTKETQKRTLIINGNNIEIKEDKRSKLCELDADVFGYKIFLSVLNTTDDSIDYAYCKYKFEFAPLFLFDLFDTLDKINAIQTHENITHPTPKERKENLLKHFKIEDPSFLYENLITVLNQNIKAMTRRSSKSDLSDIDAAARQSKT